MKNWLIYIIIILAVLLITMCEQVKFANEKWERSEANVKAYASMFDDSKKQNVSLQLTIDQLDYFRDSVLQELDKTRKELRIKDRNLKVLQQVKSSFSKSDTIILKDTLFKEVSIHVDTVLGDKWYNVKLGLHYPSTVIVEPEFKSEKHIIVSSKKETVNPPKKFFLLRWFQKKMTVIHVDVVEKNPYVNNETSRYVEIIK
ncbi:MAG: hypothetical protein IJV29_14805 [Butyrivibrio sp.]|nr:hypothetical protein [Butyrivibrio sp.]